MASSENIVIAFDLYGTLLSTESIAKELATHFGNEKAGTIAALWRRYQLEYTWRLDSMSIYKSFSEVTKAALQHALSDCDSTLSEPEDIEKLMHAYDSLSTFPDVEPGLQILQSDTNLSAYVFSNGTEAMVSSSVNSSPSLSPHSHIFKSLITVDVMEPPVFKPDPRVYQHLVQSVGKEGPGGDVWLVSGNPFDVVGARAAGIQAAWVDRTGKGWTDRLGSIIGGAAAEGPTIVVDGVEGAVMGIKKWVEKNVR